MLSAVAKNRIQEETMQAIEFETVIDQDGRIYLPKEFRHAYGKFARLVVLFPEQAKTVSKGRQPEAPKEFQLPVAILYLIATAWSEYGEGRRWTMRDGGSGDWSVIADVRSELAERHEVRNWRTEGKTSFGSVAGLVKAVERDSSRQAGKPQATRWTKSPSWF